MRDLTTFLVLFRMKPFQSCAPARVTDPTPLRAADTLPNNAELGLWSWDYRPAEHPTTWGNAGIESGLHMDWHERRQME